MAFLNSWSVSDPREVRVDRGDTLIEVLVTIVVLGLAVVGLLGALLTSTAVSATHRNLATLDGVVRTLADDARYEIENAPFVGSSSVGLNPQYHACATGASSYYLLSVPYPNAAAVTSTITVFSVGTSTADSLSLVGDPSIGQTPTTSLSGNLNTSTGLWTITIPSGATAPASSTTPYKLVFNHGGTVYYVPGGFTVTSGTPVSTAAQFASYLLTASLNRWDSAASMFDATTSCTSTPYPQLQQLVLTVTSTQKNAGGSESENLLLSNLTPETTPTMSVTSPTAALGGDLSLTATLASASGAFSSAGSVTWSGLPSGESCAGGNTTALSSGWQSTCDLGASTPAGAYAITASYSPTSSSGNAPAAGTGNATVNQGAVTVKTTLTSPGSSPAALGTPITFTATVTGVQGFPPDGSVSWSNLPSGVSCAGGDSTSLTAQADNRTSTATCTLNTGLSASTYNPTATYGGSAPGGNYPSGAADHTATITESKGTPSITFPTPAGTLQSGNLVFSVTVGFPSAAATPSGSVTWTINANDETHPSCTKGGPTTSNGSSVYTCSVSGASVLQTYTATFSIAGDANYNSAGPTTSSPRVPG